MTISDQFAPSFLGKRVTEWSYVDNIIKMTFENGVWITFYPDGQWMISSADVPGEPISMQQEAT